MSWDEKSQTKIENKSIKSSSHHDTKSIKSENQQIMNVWSHNIEEEMAKISKLVRQGYNWIAMDTEFPGVIYSQII